MVDGGRGRGARGNLVQRGRELVEHRRRERHARERIVPPRREIQRVQAGHAPGRQRQLADDVDLNEPSRSDQRAVERAADRQLLAVRR